MYYGLGNFLKYNNKSSTLALGQCTDLKLLEQIFNHGILDNNIRSQDIFRLFASVNCSNNSAASRFAWNFFKDNIDLMTKLWDPSSSLFEKALSLSSNHFCSASDSNDFQVF